MSDHFKQMMGEAVAKTRPKVQLSGNCVSPSQAFPLVDDKKATVRIELPQGNPPERPKRGPSGPFLTAPPAGMEPWEVVFNSADSMIGVLGNYVRRIESGAVKPAEPECIHLAQSMEHLSRCALQLAELLDSKREAR